MLMFYEIDNWRLTACLFLFKIFQPLKRARIAARADTAPRDTPAISNPLRLLFLTSRPPDDIDSRCVKAWNIKVVLETNAESWGFGGGQETVLNLAVGWGLVQFARSLYMTKWWCLL